MIKRFLYNITFVIIAIVPYYLGFFFEYIKEGFLVGQEKARDIIDNKCFQGTRINQMDKVMIATSELRIGNLVKWVRQSESLEDEIVTVYNINRSSVRACTSIEELPEVYVYDEWIAPIEVNEGIAVKIGFKDNRFLFDYKDGCYPNANCEAICYNGTIRIFIGSDDDKIFESPYLHDFQNIYKLITGKELEINL